jgi:ADP-ribose pyrophosphatase YjhB (NUDIX family)
MNKHIFLISIISSSIFCSNIPVEKINSGAGILPLVFNTSNQQYYFLLGKENGDDGHHSHDTFSDFGGKSRKRLTETPEQIALREFKEETGLSDSSFGGMFNQKILDGQYHSVMEFEKDGVTHFIYHMYLLPIPYEQIKSEAFREALKNRDGEKSTIALFPAQPFLKTFKNFQEKPDTKHEIYQETVDGKTTEYPIRRSFRKSLQIMMQESTIIKDILQLNYSNNKVKIICEEDQQISSVIGNNNQGRYTIGTLFSLAFIGSIGIVFFFFLGKNYFFKEKPTVC